MAEVIVEEDNSQSRIDSFLKAVDRTFVPPLSSRVDLNAYAEKMSLNAENIFARIEDLDLGHASVYANDEIGGVAFLTSFSVKEVARGSGVSRALMEKVIAVSIRNGMSSVRLEVDPRNTAAVKFYLKSGFEAIGCSGETMVRSLA